MKKSGKYIFLCFDKTRQFIRLKKTISKQHCSLYVDDFVFISVLPAFLVISSCPSVALGASGRCIMTRRENDGTIAHRTNE